MTILDKMISAVSPPESAKARAEARQQAIESAGASDWLAMVLQHHRHIEAAFAEVRSASRPEERRAAQLRLATLLTGHSLAEEAVLYPALVNAGEKAHSTKAYTEQSAAKVQLGLLEHMQPMSQDYLDKLGHLQGAVAHHMYEEEGTWFLELKEKLTAAEQGQLTRRYAEEFARYMGDDAPPLDSRFTLMNLNLSPASSAPPSQ